MSAVGAASAGTADVAQVGDTIHVWGSGWADLTYLETQVSNASALTHTGTLFIAGASIHVNGTGTTLYLNDTDCTWLKLNSTNGDVSDFRCDGYFEMDNSKITSWNTTTSAVVGQTETTMHIPRSAVRFGDDANACHANISNSEISYCGYNASVATWGAYFNRWYDGTICDTTFSYLYSSHILRSRNDIIDNLNIYNNSYCALEMATYCYNILVVDSEMWNNGYKAQLDSIYGGGGFRLVGMESDVITLDNVSIHDGCCALTLFDGESTNVVIKNCEVYNTSWRGIELNTVPGAIVENNTIYNIETRALYDIYSYTHIIRNNTIHDCGSGLFLYNCPNVADTIYNNTVYDNDYHVTFFEVGTYNSVIKNTTISGPASSADVHAADNAYDNTMQDIDCYDNSIKFYLRYGDGSQYLNYTTNRIMNLTSSYNNPTVTNTYYPEYSSVYIDNTVDLTYATITTYNGTLSAATTNITISTVNEWVETSGSEAYNITINSANATEICTFTADVANATDNYGCYVDGIWSENVQAVAGVVSWTYTGGFTSQHDLETRWNSTGATPGTGAESFVNPTFVSSVAAGILFVATAGRMIISSWSNRRRKRRN